MHVCLFDIDGTLLNTGGAGQAAMEAALAAQFGVDRPVEGLSTAGRTDRAITSDLFRYYDIPETPETLARFVEAYLHHLPEQLRRRDGRLLPGVVRLLETLAEREDVLVGLLTGNFRRGADVKLAHYRLDGHFEFGGFGDEHFHRDDVAREALQQVHQRLNGQCDPQRLWVIGDTPADVRCARAIGARAIAVGTGIYPVEELARTGPDMLLPDFSHPDPFLRMLD